MNFRSISTLSYIFFGIVITVFNSTAAHAASHQASANITNNTGVTIQAATLRFSPSIFPNNDRTANWANIPTNQGTAPALGIIYNTDFVGTPIRTRWRVQFKVKNSPKTCSIDATHPMGIKDAANIATVRIFGNGTAKIISVGNLTNTTYTCN